MYDFYYTDWQLDSYKGVNDPCMNWSDSPFLVSTNLGTLHTDINLTTEGLPKRFGFVST